MKLIFEICEMFDKIIARLNEVQSQSVNQLYLYRTALPERKREVD